MIPSWGGRIVLAPGLVLYVGAGSNAERHAHHAVQLIWVEKGSLELVFDDRRVEARAALVPARIEHELHAAGSSMTVLLVDAHGARGAELDRRAHELLGEDVSARLRERVPFPALDLALADAEAWCREALLALGVAEWDARAPSRPTRLAIDYIEHALDGVPRITEAAARANTSATRLSHRFTDEIGLPFRRFVLWTRLKRAAEIARAEGDLTRAAVAAGFSDTAHLSRTFKEMFGLSPSMLLPFVEVAGSPWTK